MRRVLIVEDEMALRESLRDWLADGGYEVETAEDGEKALSIIDERDFGVVLLDLRLPGIDGIEVLRRSREKRPGLKTIIITAYPSVESAVKAMKAGAVDYLSKPFNLGDLEKLISGTLMPVQPVNGKPAGEAIARLSVTKRNGSVCIRFGGWEYIDAYLDATKPNEE
ncbi:MAG: response regulator [Chloroflexota bacterium]|nr:response regulator [Chloroflexota bacterium]